MEREGDDLVLRIPLAAGGDAFRDVARSIGRVDGEDFVVVIPPWLATKLGIADGSLVTADNAGGRFTITRSPTSEETGQAPDV